MRLYSLHSGREYFHLHDLELFKLIAPQRSLQVLKLLPRILAIVCFPKTKHSQFFHHGCPIDKMLMIKYGADDSWPWVWGCIMCYHHHHPTVWLWFPITIPRGFKTSWYEPVVVFLLCQNLVRAHIALSSPFNT